MFAALIAVASIQVMAVDAAAQAGDIVVASTSDANVKGNMSSVGNGLSADGRHVAFLSFATNLDPADTDTLRNVFVKDLTTGDIVLADTSDSGTKANGDACCATPLSADGTKVAFVSQATNLDPADTTSNLDVYLKDLSTGDITLASTSDTGIHGNSDSLGPALSADGTKVAFFSESTNLDPADPDIFPDVYVKDLTTGDITLASTSDTGVKNNNNSFHIALSADGTKVAFASSASNLDPDDTDFNLDVYVKDLTTGDITLASTSDTGQKGDGNSFFSTISGDGNTVAFFSTSTNLDPADTDTVRDLYVKDLTTGDVTLASTSDAGTKGDGDSCCASALTADGSRVAFYSASDNLDPADGDTAVDVYAKDLVTGDLILASTSEAGVKSNGSMNFDGSLTMSADGTKLAFDTSASNLDPSDSDGFFDVYVKELAPAAASNDHLKLRVDWGPKDARKLAYRNDGTLTSGGYDIDPATGSPTAVVGAGTIPSTVSGDATVAFDIAFDDATKKWSGTVIVNDPGAGFSATVPIHSWRFGVTRDGTTTRGVLWGFKAQSVPQKCFMIVFEIDDQPTPQVARVRPADDGSVVDPDLDGDGDFVFNGLGSVLVGFNTSVGAGENRGVYVFDLRAIAPCDGELTADLLLSLTGTQGDGTDPHLTLYSGTGDGSVGVTDFASGALVTGFSAFEADPFNVIDVTTVVEGALGSGESFIVFVVRPNPAASGGQGAFLYSSNEISDAFGFEPTILETTCVPH
jgi:WD40 repeat protein